MTDDPLGGWPEYACDEHDGKGWEVIVTKRQGQWALCKFVNACDSNGKPYDFLPLDTLNPTKDWKRFTRDLLAHCGSITDDSGSSVADHFLGIDMGGPAAGAPVLPGGAAAAAVKMQRLERNRRSKSYAEIYKYVLDDDVREVLRTTHLGRGRDCYTYLEGLYDRPITTAELKRLRGEWNELTIVHDIGIRKDSISSFVVAMQRKNQEFPLAQRYNQTELCEKLLEAIMEASSPFREGAMDELNAPVSSCSFEMPAPAPLPAPPAIIPPGCIAAPAHDNECTCELTVCDSEAKSVEFKLKAFVLRTPTVRT